MPLRDSIRSAEPATIWGNRMRKLLTVLVILAFYVSILPQDASAQSWEEEGPISQYEGMAFPLTPMTEFATYQPEDPPETPMPKQARIKVPYVDANGIYFEFDVNLTTAHYTISNLEGILYSGTLSADHHATLKAAIPGAGANQLKCAGPISGFICAIVAAIIVATVIVNGIEGPGGIEPTCADRFSAVVQIHMAAARACTSQTARAGMRFEYVMPIPLMSDCGAGAATEIGTCEEVPR